MATIKFVASEWEVVTSRLFSILRHSMVGGTYTETLLRTNPAARQELVRMFPKAKVGTATGKKAGSCKVRLAFMEEATGKRSGAGSLADMVALLNGERDWFYPKSEYRHYFLSPVGEYIGGYVRMPRQEQANAWLDKYGTNLANTLLYTAAVELVKRNVQSGKLPRCTVSRYSLEYSTWYHEIQDIANVAAQDFCNRLAATTWSDYVI